MRSSARRLTNRFRGRAGPRAAGEDRRRQGGAMPDLSQTVGFMGILLLLLLAGAAAGLILLPQSRRMTGKFLLFSLPLFVIVAAFFLLGVLPFGRDIGLLLLLAGAGIVGLILALGRRRISFNQLFGGALFLIGLALIL